MQGPQLSFVVADIFILNNSNTITTTIIISISFYGTGKNIDYEVKLYRTDNLTSSTEFP